MKIEAILLWLLASLLAISFIGDHPLLGLAICVLGGTMVGILLVFETEREKRSRAGRDSGGAMVKSEDNRNSR